MAAPEPYTPGRPGTSTGGTLVYLLLGPVIWAAHLFGVYALQGLICARGWNGPALAGVSWTGLAAGLPTLLALGLLAGAILAPRTAARALRAHGWEEATAGFLRRGMGLLAALSAAGMIYAGAAILILPGCPALR